METQESSLVCTAIKVKTSNLDTVIRSYGWEDVDRPKPTDNDDASMVFLAINRTYGRTNNGTDISAWHVLRANNTCSPSP